MFELKLIRQKKKKINHEVKNYPSKRLPLLYEVS